MTQNDAERKQKDAVATMKKMQRDFVQQGMEEEKKREQAKIDRDKMIEQAAEQQEKYVPPEPDPEPEPEQADLAASAEEIAALLHENARLTRRVTELEEELADYRTPVLQQNFRERLNGMAGQIVKLRADLFYNEGSRKGRSKNRLNLFVWLMNTTGIRGNIYPLTIPLNYDKKTHKLTGHLVWKGAAVKKFGIEGTVNVDDHLCAIENNKCQVDIAGRVIELDEFTPVTPESGKLLPVKRWYWNR